MNSRKLNIAIPTPATVTYASTAATGGGLATATWYARVTAIVAVGAGGPQPGTTNNGFFETTAGAEGAGQAVVGPTGTMTFTWAAVGSPTSQGGVSHYGIYCGTTGAETLVAYIPAQNDNVGTQTFTWTGLAPYTNSLAIAVPAGNALLGNSFHRGGGVGPLSPQVGLVAGTPMIAPPAVTPFTTGRQVTVVNMTAGTITLSGSVDGGVTFAQANVVNQAGKQTSSFATLTMTDIILPAYTVASAAGLYILGAE